ncbi:copper resistance protein CopC [Streptomyces sp. NRRL S-146]|uniref:copper resistance CopC/CopD family protein n=1 Tax=Streptomyces sp. NRRL S-146 TaxID=1463884 RepID=UPI0004C70D84|nr:copper resistance protein CopC [Streptomyces sp. NRRL S-146]
MPTASRRTKTPLTALLLVGTVLALLLGGAGTASAHATMTRSDPADSTVLKTAPKQITLTFSESVSLSGGSLRVLSPKNLRVDRGSVKHAPGKPNTAQVMLAGKMPKGTYTVGWRAVSADSHPISGAFTFSIGRPSATTATVATESTDDTAAARLYDVGRYVAYGGLAVLIGVALFVLTCWPAASGLRPLRRLVQAGWATLAASTLFLLLLRGPYETGRSLTSVFDLSLMGQTITGRSGLALLVRLVLLAAVGILLTRFGTRLAQLTDRPLSDAGVEHVADQAVERRRLGTVVQAVGALFAVGLALTWAAAEHASAGIQVPLAIPVSVLHLLAMAIWLGGLVALAVALYRAPAGTVVPVSVVARFSRLAFAAVVVLVATGLYQSWRQVGSLDALSTTEYGRLLALKAGAVVVVLMVASFSRQWTAQLAHEPLAESLPVASPAPARVAQAVGVGASSTSLSTADDEDNRVRPPTPPHTAENTDSPAAFPAGPDGYRRSLRRSVAAEAVLGVVVLAITTLLTGTQPSRAAVETAAATAEAQAPTARMVMVPFDTGIPNGNGKVQITFAPGRVGDNTVEALVYAADGGIVAIPELRLTLTHRAQQIGPLDAKLVDRKGYFAADRLRIPLSGVWTMQVTVRLTDVDQVTVTKDVTIRPTPA